MSRICFIGDSHLAALKLAWSSVEKDFPDATPVFFAAPGKSLDGLVVADGALGAGKAALAGSLKVTSGGQTTIAGDYDHYVVYALELSVALAMDFGRQYRAERQAKDWRTPLSDECFLQSLAGIARETLAYRTMAKLRQVTSNSLLLCPLPIADIRNRKLRQTLTDNGDAADLVALFANACARIAHELGARFLPQPAATLEADGLATKASYSSAPARFYGVQAHEDRSHMNAEYGVAVLRDLLGAIAPQAQLST